MIFQNLSLTEKKLLLLFLSALLCWWLFFAPGTCSASGTPEPMYEITESEMQKCWLEIVLYFKQIMDMDEEVRPQLVILPEFAFDKDYYTQLKTLSDKSGCLVIAGRNFVEVPGKRIMNKGAVMVPFK